MEEMTYKHLEKKQMGKVNKLKIDNVDKNILLELDKDARQSRRSIAEKLGIGSTTVDNRIRSMEQDGIIIKYNLILNLGKLGYQDYQFWLKTNASENVERQIMHYLVNCNDFSFVQRTIGKYHFYAPFFARDHKELRGILKSVFQEFGQYINHYGLAIIDESIAPAHNYIYHDIEFLDHTEDLHEDDYIPLADEELKIISLLAKDPLMPIKSIAEKLGMRQQIVSKIIKRLYDDKFILRIRPGIAPLNLGFIEKQITLKLCPAAIADIDKIKEYFLKSKECMFYTFCFGSSEVVCCMVFENPTEFRTYIMRLQSMFSAEIEKIGVNDFTQHLKYTMHKDHLNK